MTRYLRGLMMTSLFGIACVSISACGSKEITLKTTGAKLSGTVQYGTDKIQFAKIIVKNQSGSAQGDINDDGIYSMDNVPLGEVTVAVNTEAGRDGFMRKSMAQSYKGPDAKGKGKSEYKLISVPAKYQDLDQSPLKTKIEVGENTFNIEIKK